MNQKDLEKRYLVRVPVKNSADIYQEMQDIKDWEKEVFVAFFLDTAGQIISREIVSVGILNATVIHPREVFRTAILRNAHALILAHNHPSGQVKPSEEDISTTKQLKEAGDILGIQLWDHVIVGKHGHYSLHEHGNC